MTKKELVNLLENSQFPHFFLLYGADDYQIESFAKEISSKFSEENVLSLYFEEYEFTTAKEHLEQASLFADFNLLHVKTDKKIPIKELRVLINLCKKNEQNAFIWEFHESDAKIANEVAREFENNFVRIFAPSNPSEAISLLARHAVKLGINATQSALYQLYALQNESLYLCASELNKLTAITDKIDETTINRLVFSLNGISFDAFFDKIINLQNIKDNFFDYTKDPNFNEILLVNSLYSAFFRLFKIQSYAKINSKFDIFSAIGYTPPPQIAKKLSSQAILFSTKDFLDIFQVLNSTEFDLKTKTGADKEIFLLSSILNIQNLIAKNRKH